MDIVEEILNDREKGAKRLESEYRAGLMTLALRLCHDSGDAAELVNRTFAEVVASIDDYAEQSAFFGWMSKILVNIHAKDVRRKSNDRIVYPGEVPEMVDENAQHDVFREIEAPELREAIETLPDDIRQTLMLHYFMDLSVAQVAKILSVPGGTVKWRLHYARQILATKLGAAAKKPGGKALLLVVALCAITAVGAAVVAESRSATTPAPESLEGLESLENPVPSPFPPAIQPSNRQTVEPSNYPAAKLSSGQTVKPSNYQEEPTMNKASLIAASAAVVLASGASVPASAASLPAGYTRLRYVEATGEQYIDTLRHPKKDFRAVVEMSYTAADIDGGAFGYGASEGKQSFYFWRKVKDGVATFTCCVNNSYTTVNSFPTTFTNDTARHVVDLSNTAKYIDGVQFGDTSGLSTSLQGTFGLFAMHTGWNPSFTMLGRYRIYSCQLYEGAALVRDFVPCTDGSGRACLYDAVHGDTYYNGASGADLVPGPAFTASLPPGYTRLRYVEATGEQFIDTDCMPTKDFRAVAEMSYTMADSAGGFGYGASEGKQSFYFYRTVKDGVATYRCCINNSYTTVNTFPTTFTNDTARHVVDLSNTAKYMDGVQFGDTSGLTLDLAGNFYLFAECWGWSPGIGDYGTYRLYSCQLYEGATLVRDFVPCIGSGGRACLYDLVNGRTYYSRTSAPLLAGPRRDLGTRLMLR